MCACVSVSKCMCQAYMYIQLLVEKGIKFLNIFISTQAVVLSRFTNLSCLK